tara:strand:- start:495 stop:2225 length:1731 start_codon:yes stop_codon:yes gene_type:complete
MKHIAHILVLCFSVQLNAQTFLKPKKDDSEQSLQKEIKKKLFDDYFFSAIKSKSLENYEEAVNAFQRCIEIDNKQPVVFYELAKIYQRQEQIFMSINSIEKAISIEPENYWFRILYAELLYMQNDYLKSAEQYKLLIEIEPKEQQLYFMLAEIYVYANKIKKAIEVYDQLQLKIGVDKLLSMQKHSLYRQLKDIGSAINELELLIKEFPEDIEAMEILSELYLLNNEQEKAFELFKRISILNPNNGRIHLTLADYYRQIGDNETSYTHLKLAFESLGLDIDTKISVLISYYRLVGINNDITTQAYELANILLKLYPEEIKVRAVYADILYTNNDIDEAKKQYLKILENDKSKSEVWSQIMLIQAKRGEFKDLLEISDQAIEYFPLNPLFYYFNGIANIRLENYDKAILSLKNGLDFTINNDELIIEINLSLADLYHKKDQHELSDEHFEKVLFLDPENTIVLNNYAYYLSLRKNNLEKAKSMSYKCNQLEPENSTYQDTYAWVLYQQEDYKNAKIWLEKALSNGGDSSAVIIEHYGDVLYKLGNAQEAKAQWIKALDVGSGGNFLYKKATQGILYE